MSMDEIFHFDEQEFVSEPVQLRVFLGKSLYARNSMIEFFVGSPGDKDAWESKFITWLQQKCPIGEQFAIDLKLFIDKITDEYRLAAREYCYDKDGGRGQRHLNKRSRLRCVRILEELNAKRRNPQYKSISLRSMIYDKYDANVLARCLRQRASAEPTKSSEDNTIKDETLNGTTSTTCISNSDASSSLHSSKLLMYNPYEDVCSAPLYHTCPQQQFIGTQGFEYSCGPQSFVQSHMPVSRVPLSTIDSLEPGWNQCPDVFYPHPPVEADCFPLCGSSTRHFIDGTGPAEASQFVFQSNCSWNLETIPMYPRDSSGFEADFPGLSQESRIKISEELEEQDDRKISTEQPPPFFSNPNDLVLKEGNAPAYAFPAPTPYPWLGFSQETEMHAISSSHIMARQPLAENLTGDAQDDIVVEIAIFIGYPRPLEKHEIRLGRLMKVLDRFLILGSNTLKDLKNVIDCTYDYQVVQDVSNRSIRKEDFSRNRFPSSFFFIHDTFYIDLEPDGAKDITEEIRQWASERSNIGKMNVADMNTTRVVDLTSRFGAPYLYNHVGACEHLIVIKRAALRDASHPKGPYPIPIYERNFRRIACAGCKEETAEWVLWEHECMPSFTTFLCDPCYREFNFEKGTGRRVFKFKAAPCYDRRNRRAGPVELQNLECFKESASTNTDLI